MGKKHRLNTPPQGCPWQQEFLKAYKVIFAGHPDPVLLKDVDNKMYVLDDVLDHQGHILDLTIVRIVTEVDSPWKLTHNSHRSLRNRLRRCVRNTCTTYCSNANVQSRA